LSTVWSSAAVMRRSRRGAMRISMLWRCRSARVLELGCGTAVVARALAREPGFAGRVVAIDQSLALIEAGRRLGEAEGIGAVLELGLGDALATGFPDASFDIVSHIR
jgi:ubiquinone/menaquinone biosynthesis C-methylase UbiE